MDADRLLSLLGVRTGDAALETAFIELATRRRPELDPHDRDTMYDWVLVRRQGVELGFADEAYFEAEEPWKRRRSRSALVLFQQYFYTEREDVARFTGKLPFGLEWSDDRQQVRRKLRAFEAFRRSYVRDAWELREFWMTVTYKGRGKGMDTVVCQLELRPWPEKGRIQPDLTFRDWLELLGLPVSSRRLREGLRPLDLDRTGGDDEDVDEGDFKHECGIELEFAPARNLKGVYRARLGRRSPEARVLGAVRFSRAREADARQWTGELPYGLTFDDTQETLLSKLRRKPDEQEDDDLDGFALWRFPEFTLHVLYDNMKNRLMRISVMAPGFD